MVDVCLSWVVCVRDFVLLDSRSTLEDGVGGIYHVGIYFTCSVTLHVFFFCLSPQMLNEETPVVFKYKQTLVVSIKVRYCLKHFIEA